MAAKPATTFRESAEMPRIRRTWQSGDALAVIHDAFETVRDVRAALAPAFG